MNYLPLVIDIESSALLEGMIDHSSFPYTLNERAKLWWVVVRNALTGEVKKAAKGEITKEWLKDALKGCTHLIGHNAIKFDFPALKLFGILEYTVGYLGEPDTLFGESVILVDTIILSRIVNPDRFGGHSLEAWGLRGSNEKIDFRKACIEQGIIGKNALQGAEFSVFSELMGIYCEGDTLVNVDAYNSVIKELGEHNWSQSIKLENKLADLAVRRETLGFWFDKDLAIKCVEDLTQKMEELQNKVNPILPPKPMTKGELAEFTPPNTQFLKSGAPSTHIIKFVQRIGGKIAENESKEYFIDFENKQYKLPHTFPLKTHKEADISNLDHVKSTLIDVYGWIPSEWAERDFTKDSKKQSLTFEKRKTAIERWLKETKEGKYKKLRLKIAYENFRVKNEEELLERLLEKLKEDFPVKLPTSPKVRVGIEKEPCPNLIKLGEKVAFAGDFALFLTYKHRKSSIAGGEIEDMDFDNETPNSGFLSMYREIDGRVPTPAIEIGANSHRYRHIGITNIARPSSVYGKEMRSLFGAGKDAVQFGYDFSSIEARIQGHYCWKYKGGQELSQTLLAKKPNDIHTITASRLGLDRDSAKSINYMLLYGGQIGKIQKMLGVDKKRATEIYNGFWDSLLPLKQLKEAVEKYWSENGESHVPSLDNRLIKTRSKHSLLNNIFQSGAVICAKYVNVFSMEYLEKKSININPFLAQPSVCEMIAYHDECQLFLTKNMVEFKVFQNEEEANEFSSSWQGEQLSTIGHGKTWYVCLPNEISRAVEYGIKKTEEILKLNVPLGYEWSTGKNWYSCH